MRVISPLMNINNLALLLLTWGPKHGPVEQLPYRTLVPCCYHDILPRMSGEEEEEEEGRGEAAQRTPG